MDAARKLRDATAFLSIPFRAWRGQRVQWLTEAELAALRSRRISSLLEKAKAAPYYSRILNGVTLPGAAGQLPANVPLLDKRIIGSEGLESMLTAGIEGLSAVFTSGSTGEPTKFCRSGLEEAEFSMRWYRVYSAYGGTPRDTLLNVGRPNPAPRSGPAKVLRDLGVLPRICNASVMAPVEESVQIVCDFEPSFITGYANGIENIADYIVRQGIRTAPVKAALCGAMDVTERCRALVDGAFGAPAVNVYVSNEFGVVAWECPVRRGLLHVNDDVLIMEILDGDGEPVPDGTVGEVVLTSLTMTRMPLIRYRTGDNGARVAERCPCGRGLGLMTPIQGRTSHTIFGPRGEQITAPIVSGVFTMANAYQWARRFQLREQKNNVLMLLVEPQVEPRAAQKEDLVTLLAKMVGPSFRIMLEMRDELPIAPTGKYQHVVPLTREGPRVPARRAAVSPGLTASDRPLTA